MGDVGEENDQIGGEVFSRIGWDDTLRPAYSVEIVSSYLAVSSHHFLTFNSFSARSFLPIRRLGKKEDTNPALEFDSAFVNADSHNPIPVRLLPMRDAIWMILMFYTLHSIV